MHRGRKIYPVGFKVVTYNLKSLGLRRNPNILQYKLEDWYMLPDNKIEEGKGDWGGIWLCHKLSSARSLKKYMKAKHKRRSRIFKTLYDKVLYQNDYRTKTNAVNLFAEVK